MYLKMLAGRIIEAQNPKSATCYEPFLLEVLKILSKKNLRHYESMSTMTYLGTLT